MNEEHVSFADEVRAFLHTQRAKAVQLTGQATFEKHTPSGQILSVVVTNVGGKYTFDTASREPLTEVDDIDDGPMSIG